MSLPAVFWKDNVALRPSPINPAWIVEGQPMARSRILSQSTDLMACTILWDCTAGQFHWHYDFDETLHFVEGKVTIADGHGEPRTLGPGDVLYFPKGSHALWTVHEYIRKVAFCRRALPGPAASLIRAISAIKRKIAPSNGAGSLMSED